MGSQITELIGMLNSFRDRYDLRASELVTLLREAIEHYKPKAN